MANVGLNIDGILIDYYKKLEEYAIEFSAEHGYPHYFNPSNCNKFISFSKDEELDEKRCAQFEYEYGDFFLKEKMSDEVVSFIRNLWNDGNTVYIVSDRENKGWGRDNDPNFDICVASLLWYKSNRVFFEGFICTQGKSKKQAIKRWNIDYMLDTNPNSVDDIGGETRLYLLTKEYNKNVEWEDKVLSLEDFRATINSPRQSCNINENVI